MPDKHLSKQFDTDLDSLSANLLEMGGLVESQVSHAMKAFSTMDAELATEVNNKEKNVNTFEINIDGQCAEILARRQPTAKDLRLVMEYQNSLEEQIRQKGIK